MTPHIPDWKQNAEDAQGILCDAGDLLRECHESLRRGDEAQRRLAARVAAFCARACECMNSGKPWEERPT